MEPTAQPNRRDGILTNIVLFLCMFSTTAVLFGNNRCAIVGYATMSLLLLSINTGVWPHTLFWRWIRRAVGHKFDTRFTWGELNIHRPYWDLSLRLTDWHDDSDKVSDMLIVAFFVFSIYIHLPTRLIARVPLKPGTARCDKDVTFGFYTIDSQIVWRWKQGYWSWDIPFFSFRHFSTEVLSTDGKRTVWKELASDRGEDWSKRHSAKESAQAANCEVHSYQYTRRSGEIQYRMATCYIKRWTHTRKWFPFLKSVRTSIWVTFNEEIGEEVGTWKGGTTGCGWNMRRGETIEQCLRRMEADRMFERGHRENKSTKRGFLARLFLP